jgi:hypothetical protein
MLDRERERGDAGVQPGQYRPQIGIGAGHCDVDRGAARDEDRVLADPARRTVAALQPDHAYGRGHRHVGVVDLAAAHCPDLAQQLGRRLRQPAREWPRRSRITGVHNGCRRPRTIDREPPLSITGRDRPLHGFVALALQRIGLT